MEVRTVLKRKELVWHIYGTSSKEMRFNLKWLKLVFSSFHTPGVKV